MYIYKIYISTLISFGCMNIGKISNKIINNILYIIIIFLHTTFCV